MININRIELVGTLYDPKSLLGTVGFKNAVDYTIVAGKVIVKDGKIVNVDENKIVEKAKIEVEKLINKNISF